jgi:SAM-dependent methyltransferase
MLIEFHRTMLADAVRSAAFHEALKRVIVPGHTTMADLGAGTGILSFLARQLGAAEVHLVEQGDVLALAERIAERNGIDGLEFWHCHSSEIMDPPQVDVVVAEVLGNLAFEEGVIETLADAARFLKPGGVLIPAAIEQWAAPVTSPAPGEALRSWDAVGYGLDFRDARVVGYDNVYVRRILPGHLLGGAEVARRIDKARFGPDLDGHREGTVSWDLAAPAQVHGFALWWRCELVPGVDLSTSPWGPPTHWDQVFVPVAEPLQLERGDALGLHVASETGGGSGIGFAWEVTQARAGAILAHETHDLGSGHLG